MRRGYWWLIGLIIIAAAAIIFAVAHNSSNNSSNTNTSTSSSPNKPATSNAVVVTKTNSSVGQYLADSNGRALYTYDQDKSGVSNVSGSLLSSWPAYTATSTRASLPTNVGTITRSD